MYVVLAHVLLLGGVCSSLNAYEAYTINRAMRPGINLGNALEAPQEGEWGVTLDESYFKLVASKGFRSVRVPIRWSAHALAADPYTIDPAFFERVEWVIEQAFLNGLMVIINFHHYEAMYASPDDELPGFLVCGSKWLTVFSTIRITGCFLRSLMSPMMLSLRRSGIR